MSTSAMTIVISRGVEGQLIRQILDDFAAVELVSDYLWIALEEFDSPMSNAWLQTKEFPGVQLSLTDALAQLSAQSYNVVVFNPMGNSTEVLTAADIAGVQDALGDALRSKDIKEFNVIVAPRELSEQASAVPVLRNFSNLLFAPEDGKHPATSAALIGPHTPNATRELSIATQLATIFGLWQEMSDVPARALPETVGVSFRLVRSYYHWLDGREIQRSIKEGVFDFSIIPLPRLLVGAHATTVAYAPDPYALISSSASNLFKQSVPLIKGQLELELGEDVVRKKAGTALKEFTGAWLKNVATAPWRMIERIRAEYLALLTDSVQGIYGDVDTKVHVGSLEPEVPALSEDEGTFRTVHTINNEAVAEELAPIWQAYTNTIFSLIDAQPRMVTVGSHKEMLPYNTHSDTGEEYRYVVPQTAMLIPLQAQRYSKLLPAELIGTVDASAVPAYDLRAGREIQEQLAQAGERYHYGDATRVLADYRQWQNKNSTSFAACFARSLMEMKYDLEQRMQELQRQLEERRTAEERGNALLEQEETYNQAHFGLTRWASWTSLFTFIGTGIAWLFGAFSEASSATMLIIESFWFVLWLILFLCYEGEETARQFKKKNRRESVREQNAKIKNVLVALDETTHRIDVAYDQFLQVSESIGELLEQPCGEIAHEHIHKQALATPLPAALLFEQLSVPTSVVTEQVGALRSEIFTEGWLGDAHRELGGQIPGTLMHTPRYSEELWSSAVEKLSTQDLIGRDSDTLSSHAATGYFSGTYISPAGKARAVDAVDSEWSYYHSHAPAQDVVGREEVLVQVGHVAYEGDIAIHSRDHSSSSQRHVSRPGEDLF